MQYAKLYFRFLMGIILVPASMHAMNPFSCFWPKKKKQVVTITKDDLNLEIEKLRNYNANQMDTNFSSTIFEENQNAAKILTMLAAKSSELKNSLSEHDKKIFEKVMSLYTAHSN